MLRAKTRVTIKSTASYQCIRSYTLAHTYVLHEIGGRQGKALCNEHRNPPGRGREREREEGKVDGDKADAIITIFLYVPYSPLEITQTLPSTTHRVASRHFA